MQKMGAVQAHPHLNRKFKNSFGFARCHLGKTITKSVRHLKHGFLKISLFSQFLVDLSFLWLLSITLYKGRKVYIGNQYVGD